MLEIINLSAGYSGQDILREFSLTLPEGSVTALVGPNGCGKSTLLKTLTGILPYRGRILFHGKNLAELSGKDRAKQIAFLPQSRPTPEITSEKLVLHGRFPYLSYPRRYGAADLQAAQDAMAQMNISHLAERTLPSLSGGERQKVYLAMLLAQGTPVIAMDEPTTYLDIAYKFDLMETVRDLAAEGKTLLVVLHDLDLAMNYAHQIAVMDNGAISLCGSPEEICASGVLERIFHVRMGYTAESGRKLYYFLPAEK